MHNLGRKGKDKLFNFRPVFFTAVFLCAGIVFSYLKIVYGLSWWWLCLLGGLGFPFLFCEKGAVKRTALTVCILLLAFAVGGVTFAIRTENYTNTKVYDGVYAVSGIVEEKCVYGKQAQLILSSIKVDENTQDGKLIAYLPTGYCEKVRLSDKVKLRGDLCTDVALFGEYGFRDYQINENIKYLLTDVESCQVTGAKLNIFAAIRSRMSAVLYRGMDETPAAVSLAVLTGNTSGIESSMLENIRYGGIAHIFAVSGLHVGALYAFCRILATKTPLKKAPKTARFALTAALLLFYGGVCGFSASVIRAIILCLVWDAAKHIGTAVDRLETVGLAAIIILLISPFELFGVGFQLSFVAYMGILFLQQPIEKQGNKVCDYLTQKFRKTPKETEETQPITIAGQARKKVISFAAVSLAAQFSTAPVLLGSFGYISAWSLLLNFIFVPFISAVFSCLLLFVLLACILPIGAAGVVLYLPNALWSLALLLFEGVDFSSLCISGINLSVGAYVCYFSGLTFLTDKWNITARYRRALAAVCFIGFFTVLCALNL